MLFLDRHPNDSKSTTETLADRSTALFATPRKEKQPRYLSIHRQIKKGQHIYTNGIYTDIKEKEIVAYAEKGATGHYVK